MSRSAFLNQSPDSAVLHTEFKKHLLNITPITRNCENLSIILHPSNITLTDHPISNYYTCVRSPCKTYTPTKTMTRMTTRMITTTMMTTTTMTTATMRLTTLQGGEGDGAAKRLCVGWQCVLAVAGGGGLHDKHNNQPKTVKRTCEDTANNVIKNYESILSLLYDRIKSCDFRLGNIRIH
jgi:hypothetical protein